MTYVRNLVRRFGFEDAYTVDTPADLSVPLQQNDGHSQPCDKELFQQLVGSLLYAAVATRPDIAQAVAAVCRFTAAPNQVHMTAAKRILRYLKGTADFGLLYFKSDLQPLHGYCDSDWGGDRDTRRSTTGHVFKSAGAAVTWSSQKQSLVALSSCEAEYVALAAATQQAQWLRRLVQDLGDKMATPLEIFEDNQGAIHLASNPGHHKRTKHIDIRHHYLRDVVANGDIKLTYVPTKQQAADLLTKPLPRDQFQGLRKLFGLTKDRP